MAYYSFNFFPGEKKLIFFPTIAPSILWNDIPLTLRNEGKDDRLTIGGKPWGSGDGVYYQNLPTYLKSKMPLYGTKDVNTGDANTLYLPTDAMVYMLRRDDWAAVDMTGWNYKSSGSYLTVYSPGSIKIYSKKMAAGTYTIDNLSAMYLFDTSLIYKFDTC